MTADPPNELPGTPPAAADVTPPGPPNIPPAPPEKRSHFQGLARHSAVYAIGGLIGNVVSVLLTPIYTRFMTPADYGVMSLIEQMLQFITLLAGTDLALGVFRYYHDARSEEERAKVLTTSFLLVAGTYFMVGIGTFLFASPLSGLVFDSADQTTTIRLAALNVAAGSLLIVPLALVRLKDRSILFVGIGLSRLVMSVALNMVFVVALRMGPSGFFLSGLISSGLVGLWMVAWLFRNTARALSLRAAKQLLRYGVPLMGMRVATFLATYASTFFLNAAANEAAVGLFSFSQLFGFILVVAGFSPIDMTWGPRRFVAAREPDKDHILSRGFLLANLLLISVATAIALFAHDYMRVMTTPDYYSASAVVPLILIAYILQCWASIQDIGVLVSERTEFVTLANVGSAVVAVTLYWLLIPRYLAWGAAAALLAAFFVRYILTYIFAQRLWPVRYEWRPVAILVGWAVLIVVTGIVLPEFPVLISIPVRGALGLLFLAGVWYLPILEEGDRHTGRALMTSGLAKVRSRLGRG